jgi:hypothetical protein
MKTKIFQCQGCTHVFTKNEIDYSRIPLIGIQDGTLVCIHCSFGKPFEKANITDAMFTEWEFPDNGLKKSNFKVQEIWTVDCPHCEHEQPADFNDQSPMSPMKVTCEFCHEDFLLTYER